MISIVSSQSADYSLLDIACTLIERAQDYETKKCGITYNTHGLSAEDLKSVLMSGNGMTFVSFDNDEPIGTLTLIDDIRTNWYRKKEPEPRVIKYVAVSPEHQGKGVASQLVQKAISETEELVSVSTDEKNAHAIHLYEKCGFTLVEISRARGADGNAVRLAYWSHGCPWPGWVIKGKLALYRVRVMLKQVIHY